MINEPLVSVIVLAYNQEKTVRRTLDSILAQQSRYFFEIIIGEDASPSDKTRAVCESYAEQYPDIVRVIPRAPNKGVLRNYRDCIAECRGKYFAACAGDDWWHNPSKLELEVDFLESNPDYGLVYTDYDLYDVAKQTVTYNFNESKGVTPPVGEIFKELILGNTIAAGTVLFSRAIFDKAVDLDKYIELEFKMEDYPMWLDMSIVTKFHYLPVSTFSYTLALDSESNKGADMAKTEAFEREVLRVKEYFITKNPTSSVNSEMLLEQFNLSMYWKSVFYAQRVSALRYARALRHGSIKNFMRQVICYTPLFNLYNRKLRS